MSDEQQPKVELTICFGTSCLLRGAQELYTGLTAYVKDRDIENNIDFKVSFCRDACSKGPNLVINGNIINQCTLEKARDEIEKLISITGR